jgi:dolichol-phosphate mannosyltransferase
MKISTVIAAYNEKENIIELIQRLINVFRSIKVDYEIILVVQGDDGSLELLQDFKNKSGSPIHIYYYEKPIGVGVAFKIGFHNISEDATHILTMDADLNHQPEDLPKFLKTLEQNNVDIVIGSRYIPGGTMKNTRFWRYALSRFVNDMFSYLCDLKIRDKSSGYRLQKKEVVFSLRDKIKAKNFDFYIDYLIMAQRAGFSMAEIPITFIARTRGRSKLKITDTLFRYLILIVKNKLNKY